MFISVYLLSINIDTAKRIALAFNVCDKNRLNYLSMLLYIFQFIFFNSGANLVISVCNLNMVTRTMFKFWEHYIMEYGSLLENLQITCWIGKKDVSTTTFF